MEWLDRFIFINQIPAFAYKARNDTSYCVRSLSDNVIELIIKAVGAINLSLTAGSGVQGQRLYEAGRRGGSITRRHRIIDTYCCRMSFVSAPGWSSRFRFLCILSLSICVVISIIKSILQASQGRHELATLIHSLEGTPSTQYQLYENKNFVQTYPKVIQCGS